MGLHKVEYPSHEAKSIPERFKGDLVFQGTNLSCALLSQSSLISFKLKLMTSVVETFNHFILVVETFNH